MCHPYTFLQATTYKQTRMDGFGRMLEIMIMIKIFQYFQYLKYYTFFVPMFYSVYGAVMMAEHTDTGDIKSKK